jgi:hypothetical protein
VPTIIQVITSLPINIPRGSDHQPLNGGQFGNSPRRSSSGGDSPGKPPFNPHVRSFEWLTPNLYMFIAPWYQPPVMQPIEEPTTKLPYRKLQYPIYVIDINPHVHIRVFKKAIKANGEVVEFDIINLFGFTLRDSISKWGENYI